MNKLWSCILFISLLGATLAVPGNSLAQHLSAEAEQQLANQEESLKELTRQMVFSNTAAERFRGDSLFIRSLIRALKTPNSFYYPFDSLNISRLYAPDSSFRIFTWQLKKDEYVVLQKGAIQMNTSNGQLKLFPLFDNSMFTAKPLDSVRNRLNWIGAIYYKIIQKEYKGVQYYTLLGFDEFSPSSNKKWMEVLHFDKTGEPVFGGQLISFKEDSVSRPVQSRFSIEYKKEARAFLNYDPQLDLIIVDHLISESDEPERKSTYVPDGDYEAFRWKNGQWVHIDKLFNMQLKDGEFPREALLYDDAGKPNEKQLEDASRKNFDRKNQLPPAKKDTTKKKSGGNDN